MIQERVVDEDGMFEQVLEPMPFEECLRALLKITLELADAELQSKLFLGAIIGRFSSPHVMLKDLYDFDLWELVEVYGNRLTPIQRNAAERLIELTNFYEPPLGPEPGAWKESARLTLADPTWHEIQNAARDFVNAFAET